MKFTNQNTLGLTLVLVFTLSSPLRAEETKPTQTPDPSIKPSTLEASLRPEISKVVKENRMNPSHLGFALWDLRDSKLVDAFHAQNLFVPASVQKILTALYTLDQHGPHFQFQTQLRVKGDVDDGTLKGEIFLVGGGDALLSYADLMQLAHQFSNELKNKEIKKLEVTYHYDDFALPAISIIDPLGENDKKYNPTVTALSSEFNRFLVLREGPRRSTRKSSFTPIPNIKTLEIDRTTASFKKGERFRSEITDSGEKWTISNTVRYRRKEELPARNPSALTAEVFRDFLQKLDIALPAPTRRASNKDAEVWASFKSIPLWIQTKQMLEYSNNLLAESLLLSAAKKHNSNIQSHSQGVDSFNKWIAKLLPENLRSKTAMANGSGMSSRNQISPEAIVRILNWGYSKKFDSVSFPPLLSIGGWSGWIARRLRSPDTALQFLAKTGSLDFATGIAGYLHANSGRPYAFAVFITDPKKRIILDSGTPSQKLSLRAKSLPWRDRSHAVQDALLRSWILSR